MYCSLLFSTVPVTNHGAGGLSYIYFPFLTLINHDIPYNAHKNLDLPLKNSKNPKFTQYTPTIPWDFQYSFSNTDLHIEEALPGNFLPNLGTSLKLFSGTMTIYGN